jgi:hypothetical protein
MISPLTKVLLAGASALLVAGAALTITPVYHNFGDVGVMGLKAKDFQVTLPPGSARGITLEVKIIGPDAGDFFMGPNARGLVRPTVDPFDPNIRVRLAPQAWFAARKWSSGRGAWGRRRRPGRE